MLVKLDYSSSQIADVIGVSSASVKRARNRLRKKMGLNEEDNFYLFIKEFEMALK